MVREPKMEGLEGLRNKNILITGGAGFIGGHLVDELVNAGANVTVPYLDIDPRSIFSLRNLGKKVTCQIVDIVNYKDIYTLILENRIEFIVHLAAQTLVTLAYKNPYETLETNIMGTVNILEAARTISSVKSVIVASSDKAYGKTKNAYTEDSPLAGDHPYDVSKSSADLISQAYHKTYGVPVVVTRFGNVYGEGDLHFDRIIPGICQAIIRKELLLLRSDGSYVRDYLYVKDVVNGYIHLLTHIDKTAGEAYNFSSSETFSVLDLIREAEKILDLTIPYKIMNSAKNEIPYQHLDDSKMSSLGWVNKYSLQDCLPQVLGWYRKNS